MINTLPKIELHCHLDGSVRIETIIDIARKENIEIPCYDYEKLKDKVTVKDTCSNLNDYLEKFDIANSVMQTKESLERITYELLEDASIENIKYMEIRFAPQLHTKNNLTYKEIVKSVINGIKKAEKEFEIKANIIISLMRNLSVESAFEVIKECKEFLGKGVVAVDLVSVEYEGFSNDFIDVIKKAKEYGYNITIHAGEQGSYKNVIDAINLLGAKRIGHGVKIENNKEAIELVKKNNVLLEMCPTSNIQTKNATDFKSYPFYKFFKDGISVSLNTDNRTVSDINLTNEIESIFGNDINLEDYKKIYKNTIKHCFCDEQTKKWLKEFI